MRAPVIAWTVAGLVAATAGAVAGCGSGSAATAQGPAAHSTTPRRSTTTTASTATTTPTTIPNPDLPGTGKPIILLGDMNTPQQFIIGELYLQALQSQGFNVQLSRNIGPTSVTQAAIKQGSLDIYPEYLDVYDSQVAGDDRSFTSEANAYAVAQRYARAHGEDLLTPTPFSDTSGVAVLSTYAHAHHLHSIADLAKLAPGLSFGSPAEFSLDPDGLAALERAYGFSPALSATVNLGSQYRALTDGSLQAAYDQTTDWELSQPQYVNLSDPKHVLGFGNVIPVISAQVVASEGPDLVSTIDQVDALLTASAIRGLTAETAASTQPALDSAEVAKEFLQGYGIVSPPPWATISTTTPQTVTSMTDTTPLTSTVRLSKTAPVS